MSAPCPCLLRFFSSCHTFAFSLWIFLSFSFFCWPVNLATMLVSTPVKSVSTTTLAGQFLNNESHYVGRRRCIVSCRIHFHHCSCCSKGQCCIASCHIHFRHCSYCNVNVTSHPAAFTSVVARTVVDVNVASCPATFTSIIARAVASKQNNRQKPGQSKQKWPRERHTSRTTKKQKLEAPCQNHQALPWRESWQRVVRRQQGTFVSNNQLK